MEDELFDLSTMAMEYFKEHIEPTLPEITYFGADFLDFTSFGSSSKIFFLKSLIRSLVLSVPQRLEMNHSKPLISSK